MVSFLKFLFLDSLTHIALGACMGEAMAGKQLGRKAMVAGLIAHSIPDIDFLASLWLSMADNLHAHRGFTHSILFVLLVSVLMSFLAGWVFKKNSVPFRKWLTFFLVISGLHIFLDAFNNYGVGWFEPFSDYRISFNSIYVVDPFFSIMPGIAAMMLLVIKKGGTARSFWWKAGLSCSFLYLGYSLVNKVIIDKRVERILSNQSIPAKKFMTTPAPMQTWLWFIVAETDSGFYTGYASIFDRKRNTDLYFYPKNDSIFQLVTDKKEAQKLVDFSQGYYTFEKHTDTILINDLRFGQITGWFDPKQRFAFHYYLQPETDNTLAVQRGRFSNWNRETFQSFISRIRGN